MCTGTTTTTAVALGSPGTRLTQCVQVPPPQQWPSVYRYHSSMTESSASIKYSVMGGISCLVHSKMFNDRKWNYVTHNCLEVSLYVCIQIVRWLLPSDVIIMAHGIMVWCHGT